MKLTLPPARILSLTIIPDYSGEEVEGSDKGCCMHGRYAHGTLLYPPPGVETRETKARAAHALD